MSEYTPGTWEIKHSYVDTTEYVQRMEKDKSRSLAEINEEFDRWLTEHEAKVRDDYRDRLVNALRDFNRELDVTDPFNNGFVTGVEQLIKVLDSVKERAGKSFPIIRGGN